MLPEGGKKRPPACSCSPLHTGELKAFRFYFLEDNPQGGEVLHAGVEKRSEHLMSNLFFKKTKYSQTNIYIYNEGPVWGVVMLFS